ncbi:MAG TPA: phosphate ABC transporter permease subunit PstC, partial [Bacteroidetes bacterium]|nr:phosphate ABC transporter permease subunit PstC [Bacteroidota bacterium]
EVVWGSEHYGVLFLLGIFLFVVSFGLNALTELYVKQRLIKKFQGA